MTAKRKTASAKTAARKTAPKKTAAPRASTKTAAAPRAESAPQPEPARPARPAPQPAQGGGGTLNVLILALAAFLGWVLLAPHPGQHTAQTPAAVLAAQG